MARLRNRTNIFATACIIAAFCFIALFASAPSAWAKTYTMPYVDIKASVDGDGRLTVHESRTFAFSGQFECVWWEFDSFGAGATMQVDGVQVITNKERVWHEFKEVPFRTEMPNLAGGHGFHNDNHHIAVR